ncbi:MAG: nicotinate-nucleotide adenylyltransferase [Alphaproteobacteria bacterium]|nr:nicotinate-nucleotide adenylyltransferase [Alphaproteobacteria bacterium]
MKGRPDLAPPGRARVGLLGGSFNPAHEAHMLISREARKRLDLDEVWWLVSPQNPLKGTADMGRLPDRLAAAGAVASAEPWIRVTDIESRLGTRYTADTLRVLKRRYPRCRFVWLMGADNLAQIDRWQDWPFIFHSLPIAVFDRPTYSQRALAGKAARRFARWRVRPQHGAAQRLASLKTPAWVFFPIRRSTLSATQIRAAAKRPCVG